jgi:hypothetical protein
MAKPPGSVPPDALQDPLARAKLLAGKMARVLNNEDVSDVTVAFALLTSGAVHQHADNAARARELISAVHHLEDRFLGAVFGHSLDLQ